jgi:hypothetical protein
VQKVHLYREPVAVDKRRPAPNVQHRFVHRVVAGAAGAAAPCQPGPPAWPGGLGLGAYSGDAAIPAHAPRQTDRFSALSWTDRCGAGR